MTVADGSLVRLAYVEETNVGTTPTTPSFKTYRYQNSDLRTTKQTETPDEVDPTGNASAPVDVGQTVGGNINGLLSYGTSDDFIRAVMRSAWVSNVLVNGTQVKSFTFEEFFDQGAVDTFIRYPGCRINTWDLSLEAKKSVQSNFGIMGLQGSAPATSIISGATYAAQTTTEVFNAALNVGSLAISGISNSPVMQKLSAKLSANIYANDAIGIRGTYSHGLGQFTAEGSFDAYFEDKDTYAAVLAHTTVGLSWTLSDAAGNSYLFELPKVKLLDGGPSMPGNGKPAMMSVPWKAFKDSGIGGTMRITRTPGS